MRVKARTVERQPIIEIFRCGTRYALQMTTISGLNALTREGEYLGINAKQRMQWIRGQTLRGICSLETALC